MPWSMPSQCEVCRRWDGQRICDACAARFCPTLPRCSRCALSLPSAHAACGDCAGQLPSFQATVCVADYGFPLDRLVAAFKFNGRSELASALAQRLTQAVRDALRDGRVNLPHLVLPVPLHTARLAERGYNQAWELARRCGNALGLPARADLLQRAVPTAHQAELTRSQRLDNLRAAFLVGHDAHALVAGRRIALVDDVMTTGATAEQCTQALLRSGAAEVQVWVLARTPAP
jgi:ComF family protein